MTGASDNIGLPPERRIEFRVGIHLGDVVEEADGDLMGDGVNIAAGPRTRGLEINGACIVKSQWAIVLTVRVLTASAAPSQNHSAAQRAAGLHATSRIVLASR